MVSVPIPGLSQYIQQYMCLQAAPVSMLYWHHNPNWITHRFWHLHFPTCRFFSLCLINYSVTTLFCIFAKCFRTWTFLLLNELNRSFYFYLSIFFLTLTAAHNATVLTSSVLLPLLLLAAGRWLSDMAVRLLSAAARPLSWISGPWLTASQCRAHLGERLRARTRCRRGAAAMLSPAVNMFHPVPQIGSRLRRASLFFPPRCCLLGCEGCDGEDGDLLMNSFSPLGFGHLQ